MTTDMVERIGLELLVKLSTLNGGQFPMETWNSAPPGVKEIAVEILGKLALNAIREPTVEMRRAAAELLDIHGPCVAGDGGIWREMVDVALGKR